MIIKRVYRNFKAKIREYRLKNYVKGKSKLDLLETFPLFTAHGWGSYKMRSGLTILSINQTIPILGSLAIPKNENENLKNEIIEFFKNANDITPLGKLFEKFGSDKSSMHNYHILYEYIFSKSPSIDKILEIGLGTNNTDVVSNMGPNGKPGASLRAFQEFCPDAQVFGADIDERILFREDRIITFQVDQVSLESMKNLEKKIGSNFDLMIDDGLHAPNANLNSMLLFMQKLKIGGYGVIEDINPLTESLWKICSSLLYPSFYSAFIKTKSSYVFVFKRIN